MSNQPGNFEDLMSILRDKNPRIVGIDGVTDTGKSCLARRISDELHYVVLEFDNFRSSSERRNGIPSYELGPHDIKLIQEVGNLILKKGRNIIIEGVLLLKMIRETGFTIDFLIYCQDKEREQHVAEELQMYIQEYNHLRRAHYIYHLERNHVKCGETEINPLSG